MKLLNPRSLYNFLQDENHLVLMDLRPSEAFVSCFIRGSYNFNSFSTEIGELQTMLEYFNKKDINANIAEEKYKIAKIRRIVFIVEEKLSDKEKIDIFIQSTNLFDQFDRKYMLLNQTSIFFQKYPFLTIKIAEEHLKLPFAEIQKMLVEKRSSELLYANASFPFEIIENSVFLGKTLHAENTKLLSDLNIGIRVFIQKIEKGLGCLMSIDDKPDSFLIQLDCDKIIDFDTIIDDINNQAKGKSILFAGDQLDQPAGILIAFLMKNNSVQINEASLKVFTSLGQTLVDRIIYNQVMNYTPGKLKFIKV